MDNFDFIVSSIQKLSESSGGFAPSKKAIEFLADELTEDLAFSNDASRLLVETEVVLQFLECAKKKLRNKILAELESDGIKSVEVLGAKIVSKRLPVKWEYDHSSAYRTAKDLFDTAQENLKHITKQMQILAENPDVVTEQAIAIEGEFYSVEPAKKIESKGLTIQIELPKK